MSRGPGRQRAATGPPAPRPPAIGGQLELDIPDSIPNPDRSLPVATPTTPRAALIDLADRIDAGQIDRLPDASLVRLAGLLRRDADRYPDEPETSPTGPRPTTARAALIAFADELDDILDPAVIPPATIATITHMARERARSLPDGPDAPQPIETYGVELVGTPSLDVDQQIRVHALDAAARFCTSPPDTIADVVDVAHTFEDYLRGDR